MRSIGVAVLMALAGCGGGDSPPQLVDGSAASDLPAALENLGDAVMTRARVVPPGELDKGRFTACGQPPVPGGTALVERVGVHGSSWTFSVRPALYVCDAIPDPSTSQEPDRPYGGVWCAAAVGRLDDDKLNDPRLSLCTNTDGDLTAFVWIEPQPATKWVVVSDAGKREVYEVVSSLPVRVTTLDGVQPESSRASFDIEEFSADGRKLRAYTLDAAVAG